MPEITRALFVAWRNPETHRFTPVARLAQIVGDAMGLPLDAVRIHHGSTTVLRKASAPITAAPP